MTTNELKCRLRSIKARYGLESYDGGRTLTDGTALAAGPRVTYKITGADANCDLLEVDVVFYSAWRSRTTAARARRAAKILHQKCHLYKHTRVIVGAVI